MCGGGVRPPLVVSDVVRTLAGVVSADGGGLDRLAGGFGRALEVVQDSLLGEERLALAEQRALYRAASTVKA